MARPNPVQLESFFNETIRLIESAPSERVQLQLIAAFLDRVKGYEKENESYLIQIFQKLPDFSSSLLYAGLNPNYLKDIIEQLEQCVLLVNQPEQQVEIEQLVFSYKKAMSQLCKWVGEDDHSEVLQDAVVISEGREWEQDSNGVLVPVVEQSGELRTGRLRRLKVEIIGASKQKFEIRPTFGVIGAEAGSFLEAPETAAGDLLNESRKGKNKYWIGTAVFDLSHAWHAGRSANLAVAGCYYCEMLRAEELQEYFRLNPAICVTGDLDNAGNVLAVEESSLLQKTEAAFFSWAHVLVVPADQLLQTLQIIEQLKTEFPHRELPVVGVTHIRELFFDRRLTLHHKTGTITHNLKKVWKRKFSMAGVSLVLTLLLIIGRLVYGPVDKNAIALEYSGTTISLVNKSGNSVKKIQVSPNFVEYLKLEMAKQKYLFSDIDGDGINEFIYGTHSSYDRAVTDTLICLSVLKDRILWKTPINFDLDYSHRPDMVSDRWSVVEIEELVDEQNEHFIAGFQYATFYPSVISKVSKRTGEIESFYVSPGNTSQILTEDLNGDGIDEILHMSGNNSYWGTAFSIINSQKLSGHAPSGNEHRALNIKAGNEIGYVLLPSTIVGRTYTKSKGSEGKLISFNKEKKQIMVQVYDARIRSANVDASENPMMIYTFDDSLNVEAIGSGDMWDILAKEYYEKGILNFRPGIEYLNAFKDSLLWWDGEQFVNEPTLANGYLTQEDN